MEVTMALHLTLRAAWHCLLAAAVTVLLVCGADPAGAASSKGCEGGGFAVTALADGSTVSPMVPGGDLTTTIPTARLGPSFVVKGTAHDGVREQDAGPSWTGAHERRRRRDHGT